MNLVDPYEGFSKVFDKVVSRSKYDKWEKFIKEVWKNNELVPTSLLDLACGTGINSIRFAKYVDDVFGVDKSSSMLDEARKKNSQIKFLEGDFLTFSIPKKFDAVICLDFSTNYILKMDDFVYFLNNVYGALNEGGIFIFDFKPAQKFVNKQKHLDEDEFTFDWVCNIDDAPLVVIEIKVVLKEDGKTFQERHVERGYSVDEMHEIISKTKFGLIEMYDDFRRDKPTDDSELIQVALKKK